MQFILKIKLLCKTILLLTFSVLVGCTCIAQVKNFEDSLLNELKTENRDSNKIRMYYLLASTTKKSNPSKARIYTNLMLSLSASSHSDKGLYRGYRQLAELMTIIGQHYDSAKFYYLKSIEFAKRISGNEGLLSMQETYNSLGGICTDNGDFLNAMEYLNKADSIKPIQPDLGILYELCNNYAFLFLEMNNTERALEKNFEALILAKSLRDDYYIANSRYNIGSSYRTIGFEKLNQGLKVVPELQKAVEYIDSAQSFYISTEDTYGQRACCGELTNIYTFSFQYNKALFNCNKKIVLNKILQDSVSLFESYCQKALIFSKLNKKDSALASLGCVLQFTEIIKIPKFAASIFKHTSLTYETHGDYKAALEYYKKYKLVTDSLLTVEKEKLVGELSMKYETSKKEKLISDQKLTLTQRRQIVQGLGVLVILLFIGFGFSFWMYRIKRKTAAKLASQNQKIETLIQELHHRTKNNMQVISSLLSLQSNSAQNEDARNILEKGKNRIDAMALIHQLLYTDDGIANVDFKEYTELLLTQLIHSYSKEGSPMIKVMKDVDQINLSIDLAVPLGLIINELVTNALKYGLTNPAPELTVRIKEEPDNNNILIVVKDNGEGFDHNIQSKTSLGIKLIQALTDQLKGTIEIVNRDGMEFMIKVSKESK